MESITSQRLHICLARDRNVLTHRIFDILPIIEEIFMNITRNLFLKTILIVVLIYCENFLEWEKKDTLS
jgi:hypothetical protein